MAFQLVGDILGIWGDTKVTGKPVGADIAVKKKSLPIVFALAQLTPQAAALRDFFAADAVVTSIDIAWDTGALNGMPA